MLFCLHITSCLTTAIARMLHHLRRKVPDALACSEPRPYTRTKEPPAPTLRSYEMICIYFTGLADEEESLVHIAKLTPQS